MADHSLRQIQEISALLNSSLDHATIRKRAIEAATLLMNAEAGSLLLLERNRFVTLRNSRRIAPIGQDRFSVMNLPSRAAGSACF